MALFAWHTELVSEAVRLGFTAQLRLAYFCWQVISVTEVINQIMSRQNQNPGDRAARVRGAAELVVFVAGEPSSCWAAEPWQRGRVRDGGGDTDGCPCPCKMGSCCCWISLGPEQLGPVKMLENAMFGKKTPSFKSKHLYKVVWVVLQNSQSFV